MVLRSLLSVWPCRIQESRRKGGCVTTNPCSRRIKPERGLLWLDTDVRSHTTHSLPISCRLSGYRVSKPQRVLRHSPESCLTISPGIRSTKSFEAYSTTKRKMLGLPMWRSLLTDREDEPWKWSLCVWVHARALGNVLPN
jgi:hypothetical protein